MSLFDFVLQRKTPTSTASVAKERLQILVKGPHFLPELRRELLEVIVKYVEISDENVRFRLDQGQDCDVLELNISLVWCRRSESNRHGVAPTGF